MPLAFLGVLCLLAVCSCDHVFNRQVVATVNGEKIYLEEYQQRLNAQKGLLSPRAFPDSLNKREMLGEEILDSMITEKIILQRARERKLSVGDAELEKKLIDIRKDYGDNFFDLLSAQNVRYDDWREELRKEMLFDKLVRWMLMHPSVFRKMKPKIILMSIPFCASLKHASGRRKLL